jgi:hypothetical protein
MSEINLNDYETRDKYEGCHPVIAEALKNNRNAICRVWCDNDNKKEILEIKHYSRGVYYTDGQGSYTMAEPIRKKKKRVVVRSEEYIRAWLDVNGYKETADSEYFLKKSEIAFNNSMFIHCGKNKPDHHVWHPDWLEEVEE